MKSEAKPKPILTAAAELLEKNRGLRYAICAAAALLALVLFLTSGVFGSCRESPASAAEEEPKTTAETGEMLEKRLESVLSKMAGVGKVTVMLTLEQTSEQVLASDGRSSSSEAGISSESRPATVTTSGRESPIVLTERMPRVRGVIVVAEGAANIAVRMNISAAVSTVLGIDEKCVEVFVMQG